MVLLIDNYDSFSYNLYQLIGELTNGEIKVVRNDEITISNIIKLNPSHIILSPGPGKPKDSGICNDIVKELKGKYPILGVCLGHQCICENFGGKVIHASHLMHGKKGSIKTLKNDSIFNGVSNPFTGARYHSLSADINNFSDKLEILAIDENDNEIMAVKHKQYLIYGLQFHPESVLTKEGKTIVKNFLDMKIA